MNESLFSVYLKYDGQFRTLHKIALAQMVLKILYFEKTELSLKKIHSELVEIVKGAVKYKELKVLLRDLTNENKVNSKDEIYSLENSYRSKVDMLFAEQSKNHTKVIEYWFGKASSDLAHLEIWFTNATIQFFSSFSKNWITEICKNGKKKISDSPNIKVLLNSSFEVDTKIADEDKEWLVEQYIKFLDSNREVDNSILWSYGTSCFASSMITAGRSADKLTVEIFKESKFILDTNVLLILQLEADELSTSLYALEKVMQKLHISPGYFYISREEYLRAIGHVQTQTQAAFSKYDEEVLIESNDPFLKSAINLGCESEEDLNVMFGQLTDLPEVFYRHLSLEVFDEGKLNDAILLGADDLKLQKSLDKIHVERFNQPKRENARVHDAGMISGAVHLRKSEKCWIITKDGTVRRYAIENIKRNDEPIAVSLVSLMNMMAINSGGASVDPTNFAPLFARMIRKSLLPDKEVFTLADLSLMVERESQINELPKEDVIEIAKEINKMRFSGGSTEEIDLYMRRALQTKKLAYNNDIATANLNIDKERREKEIAEKLSELAITNFKEKRKKELIKEKEKTVTNSRIAFIAIVVVIMAITAYFLYNIESDDKYVILLGGLFVEIVGSLIFNRYFFKPKMLLKYSEIVTSIDNQIEEEVLEMKTKSIKM